MMEHHLKELNEKLQEEGAEQEKNINNLISAIPPLILEEYPPKPQPPQKPKYKSYYMDKKEEREDKKAWKIYEKEMSIYERKTIPKWEKECANIKFRNDILQLEWDNKYKTMDNLRKAQNQINYGLSRIQMHKQQAKLNNNRVLEELHKA